MPTPTKNPHQLFLLAVPILLLVGLLSGDAVVDLNIKDTYFVMSYLHITILLGIFFGIMGLGYWIMQKTAKKLSPGLTLGHTLLTFSGTIAILVLSQLYSDDVLEYRLNNILDTTIKLIIT